MKMMKKILMRWTILMIAALMPALITESHAQAVKDDPSDSFSFVFMTDIHLTYDRNAIPGFRKAIEKVNTLNPDFVLTGGDLIMDALNQRYTRADSLYDLYQEVSREFTIPVYNTMGNHEIWGIYKDSGADRADAEYGERMFEQRLGRSYYAFDHKGWKFMVLNSVEDTKKGEYIGMIDSLQMEWIRTELGKTDTSVPIVLSLHIPLITASTQKYYGSTVANDSGTVVVNAKKVLALFEKHNLKLVLQGHLHIVEEIMIDGIRFITGGAVSAAWWRGPFRGYEEGFVLVTMQGERFSWEYIDYGWDVRVTPPPPRSSR